MFGVITLVTPPIEALPEPSPYVMRVPPGSSFVAGGFCFWDPFGIPQDCMFVAAWATATGGEAVLWLDDPTEIAPAFLPPLEATLSTLNVASDLSSALLDATFEGEDVHAELHCEGFCAAFETPILETRSNSYGYALVEGDLVGDLYGWVEYREEFYFEGEDEVMGTGVEGRVWISGLPASWPSYCC